MTTMARQSTQQGTTVAIDLKRVTRSESLASRRITRSGKEFSFADNISISPRSVFNVAEKHGSRVIRANANNDTYATPSLLMGDSGSREISPKICKMDDSDESIVSSTDSDKTIAITSEVLRNDYRVVMLVSELRKPDNWLDAKNSARVDVSAVQSVVPCLGGSRRFQLPRWLALPQLMSDCSNGDLFRQRMEHSLAVALGLSTPVSGASYDGTEDLIFNARRGLCTKVYVACLASELTSLMSILTSDLVEEASFTCMQDSLLSNLMNEELGEFCEIMLQAKKCLCRLRNTVDSIVSEHLEDLYECLG